MKQTLFIITLLFALGSKVLAQGCDSPAASSDGDKNYRIIGYVQNQYEYTFENEPTNTFSFERARLGITGTIPYDFQYYAMLETSPFLSDETGNAYLLDAYLSYTRYKWARVSMGAFKNPFGLELSTACHSLNTIFRSKAVIDLAGPFRDMGLMFLGGSDTTFLQYRLAILNGTGIKTKDTDPFKDVVGRVVLSPSLFTDWYMLNHARVGLSGRYGLKAPAVDGMDNDQKMRYGADIDVSMGNIQLQAEYIYGEDKGSYTEGGGCSGGEEVKIGNKRREGYFVQAMYTWRYMFQPIIKYEYYNADLDALFPESINNTTFGLNIFFNDNTRMQLNYIYAAETPEEKTGTKNIMPYSDRVVLQLQFKL